MGLVVDNFAGGGGASTGIEAALGRAVDIAINHDAEALRMHEANHPGTRHIRNNIWQVDPVAVTEGRPVDLAWFSPDCKHFSKAKGGKPREKSIRDLAWVVVLWAQKVKPGVIFLENVEEFRTWGPLDEHGQVIKHRAGETFGKWCRALRRQGYRLQFRELRACDYGAPTIRKRFFMIARCDGAAVVWPEPTHGRPDSPEVLAGKRLPWRTAAEIIDWSIPCPSIFERKKPLADKTLRRIAHGIMKFVVNNPKPFIVPNNTNNVPKGADEPLPTVTTGNRNYVVAPLFARTAHGDIDSKGKKRGKGQHPAGEPFPTISTSQDSALIGAHLVHLGNGEREGQAPRAMDAEKPLGTVVAGGKKHAAVSAFLHKYRPNSPGTPMTEPVATVTANSFIKRPGGTAPLAVVCAHVEQANGSPEGEKPLPGRAADDPLSTVVSKGCTQRLVTSNLIKLRGTCAHGQAVDEPVATISAQGTHMAEVRAFLLKYYGTDQDPRLEEPLHSCTTKDRFGLVTVAIDGEEYVIVDIGMRMLTARELFNAQGFPPDYVIDRDSEGRAITKTSQVAKCGNSVCPPIAEALVQANVAGAVARKVRAA